MIYEKKIDCLLRNKKEKSVNHDCPDDSAYISCTADIKSRFTHLTIKMTAGKFAHFRDHSYNIRYARP